MRKRKVIPFTVALLLIGGWLGGPRIAVSSIALASKKGEESSRRARDRIVFFGERAIQPTIASIEEHSPWVRRYCYLPSALEKIGGSAHSDLLAAIDEQRDPKKRAHLIYALQSAFDDFSRFGTVINDLESGNLSERVMIRFAYDLKHTFPDAPELLTDNREINPAFKAYWDQHMIAEAEQ